MPAVFAKLSSSVEDEDDGSGADGENDIAAASADESDESDAQPQATSSKGLRRGIPPAPPREVVKTNILTAKASTTKAAKLKESKAKAKKTKDPKKAIIQGPIRRPRDTPPESEDESHSPQVASVRIPPSDIGPSNPADEPDSVTVTDSDLHTQVKYCKTASFTTLTHCTPPAG